MKSSNLMDSDFQARLRHCIDSAGGGSIAQFARLAGVPDQSLRDYLRRNNMPAAPTALKIARAAGVNPYWLVLGEGKRQTEPRSSSRSSSRSSLRSSLDEKLAQLLIKLDSAFPHADAAGKTALIAQLEMLLTMQNQGVVSKRGGREAPKRKRRKAG